ncbi:MAG: acylphosphatase [Candidatus Magasanikbacteria bacterium]
MKQLFLKIHGNVQGVFFRASVKKKADEFGACGWIKNMPDGTVEILAEGEGNSLTKFKKWCITGSSQAKVEKVEEQWEDVKRGYYEEFKIHY